jgi:hypothetical protein
LSASNRARTVPQFARSAYHAGARPCRLLAERETEKSRIEGELAAAARPKGAAVLAHPVLLKRFEEKVRDLRAALSNPTIHTEAVDLIQDLLESVTIHPDGPAGAQAEVVAETAKLLAFANEKSPRRSRVGGDPGGGSSSIAVVAGTRFDLCRIRKPLRPITVPRRGERAAGRGRA